MAIMQSDIPLPLLTFEQYMAEGEFNKRYAIIDGERIFMPSPTWRHQRISRNVTQALSDYEAAFRTGLMVSAPLDVLIQRQPLRTRQPDALFISHGRLAQIGGTPPDGPLPIGPELVVEILSPSDTTGVLADKIADYQRAGVEECWLRCIRIAKLWKYCF